MVSQLSEGLNPLYTARARTHTHTHTYTDTRTHEYTRTLNSLETAKSILLALCLCGDRWVGECDREKKENSSVCTSVCVCACLGT